MADNIRLTCRADVQRTLSEANYPEVVTEDPDGECDEEIAIASKGEDSVGVQICNYPQRDGGFHVIVNRWSEADQTSYHSAPIRNSITLILCVQDALRALNKEV